MICHVCLYALEGNLFFQIQRQDARLPSACSMATGRTWSRDVVVAARLRHINATLLISLPVPPVVIRTQRPQPEAERMAAGGGGGDTRRKHSAFTVGGAGRRHCGAPILRRYAATSALLFLMAFWSGVPSLQRRE
jgi:hypothetical protein